MSDAAMVQVSWSVDGTDVTTTYPISTLLAPHNGEPSRLEWLLKSLARDGSYEVKVSLCV